MYASHYIIGLTSADVVYCHLPLYHSSGGQVATSSSLLFGAKTIIRKKFSASAFWKDCVEHGVTASIIAFFSERKEVHVHRLVAGHPIHRGDLPLPPGVAACSRGVAAPGPHFLRQWPQASIVDRFRHSIQHSQHRRVLYSLLQFSCTMQL